MKNEISLDEIIEWATNHDFLCVDDANPHGTLWKSSFDGEELWEDEMVEIIEEEKKATEETYKFLYWHVR
jgi:hypothetical protein